MRKWNKGLYEDERNAVTSGDVLDVIYWQTKFATLKLDAALKSYQPEGAVRAHIPSVMNGCAEVLKAYPRHIDVQKWRENAVAIQKKIDLNAPAADFLSGFGEWRDYSYEAAWLFYHLAKISAAAGDRVWAYSYASDACRQLGSALERMAAWSPDAQVWIKTAHAEMQLLQEEAAKKK